MNPYQVLTGDALSVLRSMPSESVNCIVTSPPYWGLRDYGHEGQLGLEATPQEFVSKMTEIFRECRRVLTADGVCWVNLGDSYSGSGKGAWSSNESREANRSRVKETYVPTRAESPTAGVVPPGLKPKDLVGIPWRVAFALQDDGWFLRSDIIWAKPNPMPESVRDRPTRAHEYIFLLTKNARYWYDADAISEPVTLSTIARVSQPGYENQAGSERANGGSKTNGPMKAVVSRAAGDIYTAQAYGTPQSAPRGSKSNFGAIETRNARTVWSISTQGYPGAHFATFPEELPRRCILAGCPEGGVVLDPFAGSGTTLAVAVALGRKAIGIELNPEYVELIHERMRGVTPSLFADAAVIA